MCMFTQTSKLEGARTCTTRLRVYSLAGRGWRHDTRLQLGTAPCRYATLIGTTGPFSYMPMVRTTSALGVRAHPSLDARGVCTATVGRDGVSNHCPCFCTTSNNTCLLLPSASWSVEGCSRRRSSHGCGPCPFMIFQICESAPTQFYKQCMYIHN